MIYIIKIVLYFTLNFNIYFSFIFQILNFYIKYFKGYNFKIIDIFIY
jgi:hypothetical protein